LVIGALVLLGPPLAAAFRRRTRVSAAVGS
jgi:hypothetical protein